MITTKATEASRIMHEHLVRILSEEVERTFSTEGQEAGARFVTGLFRHLDETALRELAYKFGITTEADLEPKEGERRP
jgi:hypothetical protein